MTEKDTPKPQQTTRRVILKREDVVVLPEGLTTPERATIFDALASLNTSGGKLKVPVAEAWMVVDETEAVSKDKAIEAYAGKPNTPEAKPGAYRAPTASTWAGGLIYERPPETKVERRRLED